MERMQIPFHFPVSARCWLVPALLAIVAVAGCASAPSVETQAPPASTVGATPTRAGSIDVEHSQKFARWVLEFSTTARAAGIDEADARSAFDDVHFMPRVIELDRAQPEFTRTVWDYLDSAAVAAARRAGPGQAAATARRGRADRGALRRAGRGARRDLGHREQFRQQRGRHPDHRRAGDAGLRGPARGTGRAASCSRR